MTVPQRFPEPTEASIATYDSVDIITGQATAVYYAAQADNGTTGFLTRDTTIFSDSGATKSATDELTNIWIEFSLTLNRPLNLNGEGYLQIPSLIQANGTGDKTAVIIGNVTLDRDGTETILHSGSVTHKATNLLDTNYDTATRLLKWTESNRHLKEGDKILVRFWRDITGAGDYFIGHDPANRLDAGDPTPIATNEWETSQCILTLPLKVDLS